jgi:hypothetical protein
MKTNSTCSDDFAEELRKWFEEDQKGAARAKLMFETGFRYG